MGRQTYVSREHAAVILAMSRTACGLPTSTGANLNGVVSSALLWKNTAVGDGIPPRTAALAADDAYALIGRLA